LISLRDMEAGSQKPEAGNGSGGEAVANENKVLVSMRRTNQTPQRPCLRLLPEVPELAPFCSAAITCGGVQRAAGSTRRAMSAGIPGSNKRRPSSACATIRSNGCYPDTATARASSPARPSGRLRSCSPKCGRSSRACNPAAIPRTKRTIREPSSCGSPVYTGAVPNNIRTAISSFARNRKAACLRVPLPGREKRP
jgi:hypothetical protein